MLRTGKSPGPSQTSPLVHNIPFEGIMMLPRHLGLTWASNAPDKSGANTVTYNYCKSSFLPWYITFLLLCCPIVAHQQSLFAFSVLAAVLENPNLQSVSHLRGQSLWNLKGAIPVLNGYSAEANNTDSESEHYSLSKPDSIPMVLVPLSKGGKQIFYIVHCSLTSQVPSCLFFLPCEFFIKQAPSKEFDFNQY